MNLPLKTAFIVSYMFCYTVLIFIQLKSFWLPSWFLSLLIFSHNEFSFHEFVYFLLLLVSSFHWWLSNKMQNILVFFYLWKLWVFIISIGKSGVILTFCHWMLISLFTMQHLINILSMFCTFSVLFIMCSEEISCPIWYFVYCICSCTLKGTFLVSLGKSFAKTIFCAFGLCFFSLC